jgi:hypothetical protein
MAHELTIAGFLKTAIENNQKTNSHTKRLRQITELQLSATAASTSPNCEFGFFRNACARSRCPLHLAFID